MKDWKIKLEKVREKIEQLGIDAILISHLPHIRYLTGFSGSSALCFVSKKDAILITDFRYKEQVKIQVKHFKKLIATGKSLLDITSEKNIMQNLKRVGFEADHASFAFVLELKRTFKNVKFFPVKNLIEEISAVKTAEEIENIKSAIKISEKVFNEVLKLIKPGISELDIASEISYLHKKYGAEKDAFDIIVASGWRSALPHGVASAKKIKKGEFIVIDFGCVFNGYHSDITRTIVVGKATSEQKKIYQIVFDAQSRAIENAKSGLKANILDSIARNYIKQKGYGKFFGHSLGHGIGVEIHTLPRISPKSNYVLQNGNVITIEPGIYIPNFGGVRIEDDILINSTPQVLTTLPRNLIEI
ncbi:M24 family metallopeptidase [Candidatus Chrysopegis kryptomonas]|jgi:Xaa-Pro aminopeptidase|uniref:Xaa-Pro aminopeptidase n=1 Tax=Candidatus Chryseopegocella kryptomonas TaxID=1633643 RepID=A0A0P1MPQ1_9BACT|nr:Xaa-Pro peptidase family protein [Candidatus Chrysopegis kryptomonas]CUS97703.1 Xaa-Pro aminopeptidase [Candidatus Chrysopegis kryptomonas]